jgi:GR25 family glycosyltransferase involved in LPS biosynthesis
MINILHYSKLTDRHKFQIKQFKEHNIENMINFIYDKDQEDLTQKDLDLFDTNKLNKGEISLLCKTFNIYNKIIEQNLNYGIIMEDDSILLPNFKNKINYILNNLPLDFDIVYIGCFSHDEYYSKINNGLKDPCKKGKKISNIFYDMTNVLVFPWLGNNKGTDMYIISNNACKKIINFINFINFINNYYKDTSQKKINLPIDHYMGLFFYNMNAKVYWTSKYEIDLIKHGSLSLFKSSLR